MRDSLLAASVAAIWGFNFVVIEWGMQGFPPLLFAAMRFAVVLVPGVFLVRPPDAPWRVVLGVGAFMSLGQFGFLYVSIAAGMPPGLAALVLQAQVVFTILIAAAVVNEVPTTAQVVGVVLGAAGLAIVGAGRGGEVPLSALVLCVLAALSWALGNVVARASGVANGISMTVWSAAVVPLPLLSLSLIVDGQEAVVAALLGITWQAVVSTLYTAGLASLLGYGVFIGLLSRWPASAVVPWVLLVPVVAIVSAWVALGHVPNATALAGGLLVLVGAAVALGARSRGAPPSVRVGVADSVPAKALRGDAHQRPS